MKEYCIKKIDNSALNRSSSPLSTGSWWAPFLRDNTAQVKEHKSIKKKTNKRPFALNIYDAGLVL